jgi:hypothetical protein
MNANIQGLLIAAGQNLKRFLAATGWDADTRPAEASWPSRGSHGGSPPSTGHDSAGWRPGHR